MTKKQTFVFYIQDANGKNTKVSEKECKMPKRTKDYKAVMKMLYNKNEIKRAGCIIKSEYEFE